MRLEKFQGFLSVLVIIAVIAPTVLLTQPVKVRADASGDKYNSWINTMQKDLQIVVPSDQTSPNPPVVVNKGKKVITPDPSGSGRPPIVFKLSFAQFSGSLGTQNIKWLTFQAYETDADGKDSKAIDNLYMLINDCSAQNTGIANPLNPRVCLYVIYSTNQQSIYAGQFTDRGYPSGDVLVDQLGGYVVPMDDINHIFSYVMNVPKSSSGTSDNCYEGSTFSGYTTGPIGTNVDARTTDEIQKNPSSFPGAGTNHPSNFNGNCGTQGGWLSYWGVKQNNVPLKNAECSISSLFSGGAGLGDIFNKLVTCMFTSIFVPIIDWAANLVKDAAGVSKVENYYHVALAQRCGWA